MTTITESDTPIEEIDSLVRQLSDGETIVRQRASHALTQFGSAAIPALATIIGSDDEHARWECARTLATIGDPTSVDLLVQLLDDPNPGTCWDAAAGLIAIGKPAVAPLLHAIIHRTMHFTIIAGAHHAMHELSQKPWGSFLVPVYEALDGHEPAMTAPVAALKALEFWNATEPGT